MVIVIERFVTPSAVFALLIQGNQILLQKRKNTGYKDGYYDLAASGHVEANESMKEALIREVKEEIGIDVDELDFATMSHKYDQETKRTYYNGYFIIKKYHGRIIIKEPDKCSELKWFDLNNLPDLLIDDRKVAIDNYLNGVAYDEYGWSK